jgi:hypothetical protein
MMTSHSATPEPRYQLPSWIAYAVLCIYVIPAMIAGTIGTIALFWTFADMAYRLATNQVPPPPPWLRHHG